MQLCSTEVSKKVTAPRRAQIGEWQFDEGLLRFTLPAGTMAWANFDATLHEEERNREPAENRTRNH